MDAIFKLIDNMNEFLWSYILIVMLITLGLYFTFRLNLSNLDILVRCLNY